MDITSQIICQPQYYP